MPRSSRVAKKRCVCACVRACVCVCQTCIQGSCPEGPHLPHQVKQEIQAPPRPAGGPFHRGRGVGAQLAAPLHLLSTPGGWHLLSHSADEELRPRDPEMGVIPTLTDSGGPYPDQDTLAPASSVKPLSLSLGCRTGEAHFLPADSLPQGPAF